MCYRGITNLISKGEKTPSRFFYWHIEITFSWIMKYMCGLPFAIFETWYWVSPWGSRVNFPWWCAFYHWSTRIHFCKHSWGSYSEHVTVKYVWTVFWAEKDAKILVKFYCHLLVKHMKTITFWHIYNIEILSCVPLSMQVCKIKVILLLLNSCASVNPLAWTWSFETVFRHFWALLNPSSDVISLLLSSTVQYWRLIVRDFTVASA